MEQSQRGDLSTWSWGRKVRKWDDCSLSFHYTAPSHGILVLESSKYSMVEREWHGGNCLEGIKY